MAIKLENKPNVIAPNVDYPYGDVKDRSGVIPGTPINREVYADFHQFFEKLMDVAGVTHNDLPDNLTNGFQLFNALFNVSQKAAKYRFVPQVAPEANQWQSIAYGNGVFVAVSDTGTNRVMRSTDNGATWTAVAASAANPWLSVAFGNGVFVAVASSGTNRVMRSTDNGATWTGVAAAEANSWQSVSFGNGVFVAVALNGTNRVMRSTDNGATWTGVAAAAASTWFTIAFTNNVFVATSSGTTNVMRSTDNGATWSVASSFPVFSFSNRIGVFNNDFIIFGNNFYRSVDGGDTWLQETPSGFVAAQGALIEFDGLMIIVGSQLGATGESVYFSFDNGISFVSARISASFPTSWNALAKSDSALIAVSPTGTERIARIA